VCNGLVRERLNAVLDRVLDVQVCAVVAPPGWGKTTALGHWARRASVDVLWWRADRLTDDPLRDTLTGLSAALRPCVPRLPLTAAVDDLIVALHARTDPVVVVIDGFEQIASGRVGAFLERLLMATSAHVHLAIGSRVPPPLNLARSELASSVVGPSQLRFRSSEIADLFRSQYRVPLGGEDARRLADHTEGWAAALQLFHQGTAGRAVTARRRAVTAPGSHPRYAREYVGRTYLADLDAEELRLLRDTAPFEVLVGSRCDQFLGRTGSDDALDRLARRGLLMSADHGAGFTLPRVVRDHLVGELIIERGQRTVDQRFRAAAEILTEEVGGSVPSTAPSAMRTWAAAGAWPDALTLLAESWADVVADRDLSWLDSVPREFVVHPLVRAARAELARRNGRLEVARALLAAGPKPEPATAATSAEQIERSCRTWTVGDLQPADRWSEFLRTAVRRPNPDRRPPLPWQQQTVLAAAELMVAGALDSAQAELERITGRVSDPGLACAADLLAAALRPDRPALAEDVALQAEDLGLPWLAAVAGGLARADDADAVAAQVHEADERGDAWAALLLAAAGGMADLRAGRPALQAFEDAACRCRKLDAPALEAWARSGQALAAVAAGLPDAARDADSAVGFAHSAQVPGPLALARLASARCRADRDRLTAAEDEVDRLGLGVWTGENPARATASAATVVADAVPLEVRCFAGFEILTDGAEPDLGGVRPRARALLRLLALHAGHPVHREVIAEAMWPQLDLTAALHNLHVCVSGLRTALEPGVARGASRLIVRDGDRYLLALPGSSLSDLREFDAGTAAADVAYAGGDPEHAIEELELALAVYVGEVLPEDGPTEWVLPHREHYKARAAEAAARLGRLHLEQHRPDQAAAAARRSIDIDAFRDASWRLLIAAHQAAGNHAGAAGARRSYADVLASLGVAATAATSVSGPR
jgi:DNA-binding SARP family transcriptional activator